MHRRETEERRNVYTYSFWCMLLCFECVVGGGDEMSQTKDRKCDRRITKASSFLEYLLCERAFIIRVSCTTCATICIIAKIDAPCTFADSPSFCRYHFSKLSIIISSRILSSRRLCFFSRPWIDFYIYICQSIQDQADQEDSTKLQ